MGHHGEVASGLNTVGYINNEGQGNQITPARPGPSCTSQMHGAFFVLQFPFLIDPSFLLLLLMRKLRESAIRGGISMSNMPPRAPSQ